VSSLSSSHPARRGVTLLELLVVLLLMALSAVLVLPVLSPLTATSDRDPRLAVIASARRAAVRRGESLRLRMEGDGVWALVTLRDGSVLDGGHVSKVRDGAFRRGGAVSNTSPTIATSSDPTRTALRSDGPQETDMPDTEVTLVLTITALGSCLPSQPDASTIAAADAPALRFDVLSCAWTRDETHASARMPQWTR